MAGFQFSVCMVLVCLCTSSLAHSSDIQKELEVIKGQLQIIVVENNDLKKRTNELEHKVDLMTQENRDLKMKTNEQEHKLDMMTKENNDLKKSLNEVEHKMDLMTQENLDLKMKTNELDHKVDLMTQKNVDLKRRTVILERKVKFISLTTNPRSRKSKILDKSKIISRSETVSTDNSKVQTNNLNAAPSYTERNQTEERPNMYRTRSNYLASNIRRTRQTNGIGCRKNKRLLIPATTAGPTANGVLIAFSARVKDNIANVGSHQEIPFETVETNIGQAFHAGTGTFSCPQNGVYAFFVTILARPSKIVQVDVVKEGVPVAFAFSHGDSNGSESGSTSVVIRLQKGDKVWVRETYHAGTGDMLGAGYSSFMGFSLMLE